MFSKVLLVDFKEGEIELKYLEKITALFEFHQFISRDDPYLFETLKDVDAILAKISTKIDEEIIDRALHLKYIGVLSTAYDAIDAKYARLKNITVCNLGGYSTEAVAEFFFASLFEQARELERAKLQARHEDYSFDKFLGMELKDKILGVIGGVKSGQELQK
ncbi:MAG: hypothetical protein Q7R97_00110 [Candidatus Daviesbacteria bacterium]|nr:hypothetical protein [Candidatus Daviesbacteria bacterium]